MMASCASTPVIPPDRLPCARAGSPEQDTVVCAIGSEGMFVALAVYRQGETYLRKAPGLYVLSKAGGSRSGQYMYLITIGEGHPWLDVIDIGAIASQGVDGNPSSIYRIDPYPGWVDARWEGDELIVESDVNLIAEGDERYNSADDDRIYMFRLDLVKNVLVPSDLRP